MLGIEFGSFDSFFINRLKCFLNYGRNVGYGFDIY